jgi:hypothetical protein
MAVAGAYVRLGWIVKIIGMIGGWRQLLRWKTGMPRSVPIAGRNS